MVGRGGRGVALLEALKNIRAGEDPETTQPAPQTEPPPPGSASSTTSGSSRGVLQALLGRGKPKSTDNVVFAPSVEPLSCSTAASSVASTGGGRGRASLLSSIYTKETAKQEPIEAQVEQLTISEPGRRTRESTAYSGPPVLRHGTSGARCRATANYIKLECHPDKGIFEYEVKFTPDVDNKSFRYKMLNSKLPELGGVKDFDGRALYLPIRLPDQTFKTIHPGNSSEVDMKIIFKKEKNMSDNIHFFNVLFKRIFRDLKMVRLGRDNYYPNAGTVVPQHRLEVWPGYVTAVDEYEGGIMLSIDASHRILRTVTCLDIIKDAANRNQSMYREVITKQLIGSSVLTRYNNKMYTIDDILWDENPDSTFDTRDGKVSYVDYYKQQYRLEITDRRQPLLLNRFKKKMPGRENETLLICLIPELSFMTGLTDEMREDFRLMKDIATYTRITPDQRKRALKKFISNVNENPDAKRHLSDWGLTLCKDTVELESRVFPMEKICYGGNREQLCRDAGWSREATSNPVLSAVDLENWVVIFTQRNERQTKDFVACLLRIAPQMGIDVRKPVYVSLNDDRTDSFIRALRDNIREGVQIVVTICPTSRDDRYAAIKKITCVERPVASQVINAKTISNQDKMRPIVQKIVLQMNCKLGGSLWTVKVPLEGLMICGIDTYHGGAGSKTPSVGAFVASLNPTYTRWFSRVCFQERGQELVDGLKVCFIAALKKYYDVNSRFPDKIVVYRDGVGDGQLHVSRDYEVPQLESCFAHVSPDYKPKLSLVIVQKRINTRIFDITRGKEENPTPGTVIDHTITRRNWYDFFLVSQLVRQGTVSPSHYIVVKDGCDLNIDHMQRLTYKMTHMYYNWPGTVRVPAPCQYAHKLAFLVGQNIQRTPSDVLSDRLFFL